MGIDVMGVLGIVVAPGGLNMLTQREKAIDRLARQARVDTIHGGWRALMLARRMDGISPDADYMGVVGDVYSASTGKRSTQWEAWDCLECGSVCLGMEAANACCRPEEED